MEYSLAVKLLTEQHLEFLSLKGGCTGSPESTFVKMPHCAKSHVMAHMLKKMGKKIFTILGSKMLFIDLDLSTGLNFGLNPHHLPYFM